MLWLEYLAMFAVVGALIALAELADPEDGVWHTPPRRQLSIDAAWLTAHAVYIPLLGWAVARGATALADGNPLTDYIAPLPFVARAVAYALVAEAVVYGVHRTMHAVGWLWRIHAVHHSSTHLHWWSAYRFHPLETVIMRVLPVGAGLGLGLGLDALVPYTLAAIVITVYSHADVHLPGRWLDRVIATPHFHRTHHETWGERRNYALVLPVFDVVFRTATWGRGVPRTFGSVAATQRMAAAITAAPTRSPARPGSLPLP